MLAVTQNYQIIKSWSNKSQKLWEKMTKIERSKVFKCLADVAVNGKESRFYRPPHKSDPTGPSVIHPNRGCNFRICMHLEEREVEATIYQGTITIVEIISRKDLEKQLKKRK